VVERTLAWLNRNGRFANDFEATTDSAVSCLYIASVKLMSRHLAVAGIANIIREIRGAARCHCDSSQTLIPNAMRLALGPGLSRHWGPTGRVPAFAGPGLSAISVSAPIVASRRHHRRLPFL
jgi:hypothetical protein